VQLVLGYVFVDRHTDTILKTLSQTIAGDVSLILLWVETPDVSFDHIKTLAKEKLSFDIELKSERTLKQTGQYREGWIYTPLVAALDERIISPYFLRITPDWINLSVESNKGIVAFHFSRKRLFSRTTPLVLIWTALSSLLLFSVASLFMRNQIRPIRRLSKAAEQFGKSGAVVPFKPEGATEVRKAGHAFLNMRDRVHRLLTERLEMLAGVSHDLRTPITRLKLSLALMPDNSQKQQMTDDINTLHRMIEGFLVYARNAETEIAVQTTLIPCIQSLTGTVHIPIELTGDDTLQIALKPLVFSRCITNVLSNAEKYAKRLWVDVHTHNGFAVIVFEDDGPGIPESEYDNVFKPFYRLDSARNLDSGGIGLGLSVVRDAVRMHGGHIELGVANEGGFRMSLFFPLTL
jgi:two-component system osmolarity sensor histidine kinase EnvZ